MRALVTGGCGFIGSHLCRKLLSKGYEVLSYDNLSTGQINFIQELLANPSFRLIKADLLDKEAIISASKNNDVIFHFAANADVRFGFEDTSRDLKQNTIATHNVLEAARLANIKKIVFASTSAALGEPNIHPTPEDLPMPIQTSLYGASKAAAEGMISSYANGFGISALIFRFVSVLGPHYSHGHVFDFVKQLLRDPNKLIILGDGKQRKSYMHVEDCVAAVVHAHVNNLADKSEYKTEIFNLGSNEYCYVTQSAEWIVEEMGLKPDFLYTGGERGWVGDNPFVFLDTTKIRSTGWSDKWKIEKSVRDTVRWLLNNKWIFDERN